MILYAKPHEPGPDVSLKSFSQPYRRTERTTAAVCLDMLAFSIVELKVIRVYFPILSSRCHRPYKS